MLTKEDLIFAYTRAQAIADGVLIDATKTAAEAGFTVPVAVTQRAWADCVALPEGVTDQDEGGRLWDVLWMLRHAIRKNRGTPTSELRFWLTVRNDYSEGTPPLTELKAVCGPDDDGSPCLTIMLPLED